MTVVMLVRRTLTPRSRRTKQAPALRVPRGPIVTRAERAECTCPDACERDHERD